MRGSRADDWLEVEFSLEEATLVGDELIHTPIGRITLENTFIADSAVGKIYDELDYQRACQTYVWSTPTVSFMQWKVAQAETFNAHDLGDFVVYDSLEERRGIVTVNLTTPYIVTFLSLADGPVLVQAPAGAFTGVVVDVWQRRVTDIGLSGPDEGKGGTYILVGPEDDPTLYAGQADFIARSETNNHYLGGRIWTDDPREASAIKDAFRVCRVGEELKPNNYICGVDKAWSATAPRGLRYWELLSEMIQQEPTREVDKGMHAMIGPLGVKKGASFNPDDRQKRILLRGAAMGELMARNMQTNPRIAEPHWPGTHWYKCPNHVISQETDDGLQIYARVVWCYEATISRGIAEPSSGNGRVFLTTKRDSTGALFRADRNYVLRVPRDVPAAQIWTLTLYSENTRRPYQNGRTNITDVSVGNRAIDNLQKNKDGSIDLYVGPTPPRGLESNHMKTVGSDGWFVYLRLYGATEPFVGQRFRLGDFVRLD